MSRVLAVSPGATYSITEVYHGIATGLARCGHDVEEFDTLGELVFAAEHVKWTLRKAGQRHLIPNKRSPDDVQESYYDAVRQEGFKALIWEALDRGVDWLVLVSPLLAPRRALLALSGTRLRICMVFTESPYDDHGQAALREYAHLATTNDRASAEALHMGYLPMAYSEDLHYPRDGEPSDPLHDVVFVGVGFPERIKILEACDWSGINLGLYGDWHKVSRKSPIRQFVHQGVVSNERAVELYKSSLVGLNLHRVDADYFGDSGNVAPGGWSVNPRTYELAACGVPQVSDWRPGLVEVFGERLAWDMSVDTPTALVHTVRNLLSCERSRRELAARQHDAVAGTHSYRNRAEVLSAAMRAQEASE